MLHPTPSSPHPSPPPPQGIAIGNGLTRPDIQFGSFPSFALSEKLISEQEFKIFSKLYAPCRIAAKACGKHTADSALQTASRGLLMSLVRSLSVPYIQSYGALRPMACRSVPKKVLLAHC